VTGIYPLNENVFGEDEFLATYITDMPYSQVTDPHNALPSSKHRTDITSQEGTSARFMGSTEVSPEIIRLCPKGGPRKSRGRKHGKSRILRDMPKRGEIENQRVQKDKMKLSGKD
jgi:hypothetical protein